jgi:ribonuclease HI
MYSLWIVRNDHVYGETNKSIIAAEQAISHTITNHLTALGTFWRQQEGYYRRGVHWTVLQDTLWLQRAQQLEKEEADFQIYFDGGARGNPGPAGSGWLIVKRGDSNQWQLVTAGYSYYVQQTNNFAEYCAAWLGLKALVEISQKQHASVEIIGDSYLVLQQLRGRWSVNNASLKHIHSLIERLLPLLRPSFRHVRRSKNTAADFLANLAMDAKTNNNIEEMRKRKDQLSKLEHLIYQDHENQEEAESTSRKHRNSGDQQTPQPADSLTRYIQKYLSPTIQAFISRLTILSFASSQHNSQ